MESRVLPADEVAVLLAANFVCVKVNVDNAPADVQDILSQVQGNILPFYAYIAPDGKFIAGTSGFRDVKMFKADLQAALKSDLLRLPPAVEKKLQKAADQAAKDLEAKKYAAVIRAAKDAEKFKGVSDARDKLKDLATQAAELGKKAIEEAAGLAKEDKIDEALALAKKLQADFKGTEVETAANDAVKSLDRLKAALADIAKGAKADAKNRYTLILKEAKDSPWAAIAEEKLKMLGE